MKGEMNLAICVTGVGATGGFTAIMTNVVPDLNMLAAGSQCFPMYAFGAEDRPRSAPTSLFV